MFRQVKALASVTLGTQTVPADFVLILSRTTPEQETMSTDLISNGLLQPVLLFPTEWTKAALVLALISVWVVIALFAYLNHSTKRTYFNLWTVAWMFYSVYLAASIGLEESPHSALLIMVQRACIGIGALFMFWGSFQLTNIRRHLHELGWAIIFIVIWSYVAAYRVADQLWITLPVFVLLAAGAVYAGVQYIHCRRRYRGATILGLGFVLWGLHLLAFPFAEGSNALMAVAYVTSSILSLLIIVGMVVEQEANVSEHDYRALFDLATEAVFLLDCRTLRVLEANRSAQELTGMSMRDLIGQPLSSVFADLPLRTTSASPDAAVVEAVNRPCAELRVVRPGGTMVVCEGRASVVHCPKGPVLQMNVRDITQRKQMEDSLRMSAQRLEGALTELQRAQQQVIQQERLSALGKMASGLAHDFNNVLARILGFNELLLSYPESLDDRTRKHLQMIDATVQDAVDVVNRLREFYRHRDASEVYGAVDLNKLVEQAVLLTQPKWRDQARALGGTVQIQHELHEIPFVRGNETELRDVLNNLIFNAVDAMRDGGTITLGTDREADYVILRVTDTGTGMTEEVQQHCLEPFYTTKGNEATGLGLPIVYGIVKRHGGFIEIKSELGKGTSFIIHLPAHEAHLAALESGPQQPMNVLLVEDDPLIGEIEAEYLRADGHRVAIALTGKEGLERFRSEQFNLVVSDRAMPEMNGDEMAQNIKTLSPSTPVIMVTGFANVMTQTEADSLPSDLVLAKPVTKATLRQAVRKMTTVRSLE